MRGPGAGRPHRGRPAGFQRSVARGPRGSESPWGVVQGPDCRLKTLGINEARKGPKGPGRGPARHPCACPRTRHVAEVGISRLVKKAVGSGTQTGRVGVLGPEAGRVVCGAKDARRPGVACS